MFCRDKQLLGFLLHENRVVKPPHLHSCSTKIMSLILFISFLNDIQRNSATSCIKLQCHCAFLEVSSKSLHKYFFIFSFLFFYFFRQRFVFSRCGLISGASPTAALMIQVGCANPKQGALTTQNANLRESYFDLHRQTKRQVYFYIIKYQGFHIHKSITNMINSVCNLILPTNQAYSATLLTGLYMYRKYEKWCMQPDIVF